MGKPYCGNCHTWMSPRLIVHGQVEAWYCECPIDKVDTSKDPNCHNSNHTHHDPQSPIVLSRKAEYEAEDGPAVSAVKVARQQVQRTVADSQPVFGVADEEGTICGHERVDGRCNFWGCPVRLANAVKEAEEEADNLQGPPFFQVIGELDEILEETNQQYDSIIEESDRMQELLATPADEPVPMDTLGHSMEEYEARQAEREPCLLYGCVWVRVGVAGSIDITVAADADLLAGAPKGMEWGPVKCMRCNSLAPEDIPFEPVLDIEAANNKADPRILKAELEVASLLNFASQELWQGAWSHIVSNSCQKILDILSGKDG